MQVSRGEQKKWKYIHIWFWHCGFCSSAKHHVRRTSHRPNLISIMKDVKNLKEFGSQISRSTFQLLKQSSCNSCNVPSPSRGDWNVIGLHFWEFEGAGTTCCAEISEPFWLELQCFQDDMKPWSQRHSLTYLQQSEIQSLQQFTKMVFQLTTYSPIETSRLQISECQSISNLVACSCRACSRSHAVLWRLPQFWWTLGKPTRPTKSLDATGWVAWKQRGWKMWKGK